MRLGTLRIKNNRMRGALYMLHDAFTEAGAEACLNKLLPVGLKFFGDGRSRFIPTEYKEGDFLNDFVRLYGMSGDHVYFKIHQINAIKEICGSILVEAYKANSKKKHLRKYLRHQLCVDLGI